MGQIMLKAKRRFSFCLRIFASFTVAVSSFPFHILICILILDYLQNGIILPNYFSSVLLLTTDTFKMGHIKTEIGCYSWVILAGKIISRTLSVTFIFLYHECLKKYESSFYKL